MPCKLGIVKGRRAREVPWKACCSVMQYAYHAMSASPKYMADASFRRQLVWCRSIVEGQGLYCDGDAESGWGPLPQNLDHRSTSPAPKQMQLFASRLTIQLRPRRIPM